MLARSRQGFNLPTPLTQLNVAAGEKIIATINPEARPAGADPLYFVVAAAATNDPNALRWIASWKANDPVVVGGATYLTQGTARALPQTIEFTTDEQLQLSAIAVDPGALPAMPWEGALRYVQSLAKYLRFEPDATTGEVAAAGGYWVEHTLGWTDEPDKFKVYVGSTASSGGCDRTLTNVLDSDIIPFPPYRPDGSEPTVSGKYLIGNGITEDSGAPIPAGAAIGFQLSVDGQPRETEFSGKFFARYLGLFRHADGSLDTSNPFVGAEQAIFTYPVAGRNTSTLHAPEAIPRGYGALWEVYPRFHESDLLSQFVNGTTFRVLLYNQGIGSDPAPDAQVSGSVVYSTAEKLLIVPRLPGAVEMRPGGAQIETEFGGYRFHRKTVGLSGVLAADAADQKICISATLAGQISIKQAGQTSTPDTAQRALVSTVSGTYTASAWSNPVTIDATNRTVSITAFHHCDTNGKGTVRASYPDKLLANTSLGDWNVSKLRVFVDVDGTVYELSSQVAASPQPSQSFLVSEDVTLNPVVILLPDSSGDPGFCLWDYNGAPTAGLSSGGDLPIGVTVRVCVAYHWEPDNREVTVISHSTADGNIHTMPMPMAQALENFEAIRAPVASLALLRAIPYLSIPGYQRCWVGEIAAPVFWDPALSGEVEVGNGIFYPVDKPGGALGGWIIEEGY